MTDRAANCHSRRGDGATPEANLRRLWGAVLLTGISDAVNPRRHNPEEQAWLAGPAFEAVCDFASVDDEKAFRVATNLLRRGVSPRYTTAMRLRGEIHEV